MNMIDNSIKSAYSEFILAYNRLGLREELAYNVPLKKYTAWRVGGPADLFVEVTSFESLTQILSLVNTHSITFFVLGGGSNILVSDKGFRGLVIRMAIGSFQIVGDASGNPQQQATYDRLHAEWEDHVTDASRHVAVHYHLYSDSNDPNFNAEQVFVRVDAGYSMASLIRELMDQGITGLEKFTRIPGTLGGWVYINAHGHTLFIGDFVHEVRSITPHGEIKVRSWKEFDFGYDHSLFHSNSEIILDATLRLFKGNVAAAREIVVEVTKNKMLRQPSNSGGCVFHNVSKDIQVKYGFESDAVGYIVDKQLGWLGTHKVGGAWISAKHGNFIETDETATAADILAVMDAIKQECFKRYNVTLQEEILRVGEF